jgi:hypothetical protein
MADENNPPNRAKGTHQAWIASSAGDWQTILPIPNPERPRYLPTRKEEEDYESQGN